MPTTSSGMYWDTRGPAHAPAVLLLEGHTAQLIGWREEFCDLLVTRGLHVLRMDNRDVGLSRHEQAPYEIADMAGDVRDVIDDAGLERVTIVGQSMGGLIAQHVALDYPESVAGLVLFYTTSEIRDIDPLVLATEIRIPESREDAVAAFLSGDRATTSPAWGYDEEWKRELADRMFDRDPDRSGLRYQQAAIAGMPDITVRLERLEIPVALIHGRADATIAPRGSERIAEHIPQAELHLYPGMGHEIAPALWDDFARIIARVATFAPAPVKEPA